MTANNPSKYVVASSPLRTTTLKRGPGESKATENKNGYQSTT